MVNIKKGKIYYIKQFATSKEYPTGYIIKCKARLKTKQGEATFLLKYIPSLDNHVSRALPGYPINHTIQGYSNLFNLNDPKLRSYDEYTPSVHKLS